MTADVALFADSHRESVIDDVLLGDIVVPIGELKSDEPLTGTPRRLFGRNTGDTHLIGVTMHVDGEGRYAVQIAQDNDGEPGVWAAPGESIALADEIAPGDDFDFWARGIFQINDAETKLPFEFSVRGKSEKR